MMGVAQGSFTGVLPRIRMVPKPAPSADLAEMQRVIEKLREDVATLRAERRQLWRVIRSDDAARQVVEAVFPPRAKPAPIARNIGNGRLFKMLDDLADRHNVEVDELCGPCRVQRLVRVRAEFAVVARDAGATMRQIGAILGGRDHSTVCNLIKCGRAAEKRPSEVVESS